MTNMTMVLMVIHMTRMVTSCIESTFNVKLVTRFPLVFQVLKDLVAKRMLKIQQSSMYSETVTDLRKKVVNLERRNMELEDKADRLQTLIINLKKEVDVIF